jgi:ComF family protein
MTRYIFSKLLDLLEPRACMACGRRLSTEQQFFCSDCLADLPLTDFHLSPYDNEMARMFWGRIPHFEKALSLMYYHAQSTAVHPIYALKYFQRPGIGFQLGQWMGNRWQQYRLFDDIDLIVPVPLAPVRLRNRGYNQSVQIAQGIASVINKKIATDLVSRSSFTSSQTHLNRQQRAENVEHAFYLSHADRINNKHLLLVDDVVTTGATMTACARELSKLGEVHISVASIGFVSHEI